MSAVVSEDKRRHCIEQVLKINPNNQQAAQALEKLKQTEKINPQSSQKSVASNPEPSADISPTKPKKQFIKPKLWINQKEKNSHIMGLVDDKLIVAKCDARLTAQAQNKLMEGSLPVELLTELTTVSCANILTVDESVNSINIEFMGKNNQKEKVGFECKNKEMGHIIIQELEDWLKPGFTRTTSPMSRKSILFGNSILASIILLVTAFFYFAAKDVQMNGITQIGSGKTKLIVILLDWIGTGGVTCIGGGILLTVLAVMISSLINPPLNHSFP